MGFHTRQLNLNGERDFFLYRKLIMLGLGIDTFTLANTEMIYYIGMKGRKFAKSSDKVTKSAN